MSFANFVTTNVSCLIGGFGKLFGVTPGKDRRKKAEAFGADAQWGKRKKTVKKKKETRHTKKLLTARKLSRK